MEIASFLHIFIQWDAGTRYSLAQAIRHDN